MLDTKVIIRKLSFGLLTLFLPFSLCVDAATPNHTTNFRFNPLAVMLGGLTGTLDFRIHPEWTLGLEMGFINYKLTSNLGPPEDTDLWSHSLTVRSNWFKNGVFQEGMYVGPFVSYAAAQARLVDKNGNIKNRADGVFAGAVLGNAWVWESFNVMLGGGLTLPMGQSKVQVENSNGTRTDAFINGSGILILELSLGWTF